MQHLVPLLGPLVVEVEVLEGLGGREAGGRDAALAAVVLAGAHLPLKARREELLVAPASERARSARRGTDRASEAP